MMMLSLTLNGEAFLPQFYSLLIIGIAGENLCKSTFPLSIVKLILAINITVLCCLYFFSLCFAGLSANCGPPPSIENGVVMGSLTENYEDGSTIQYSCNEYHVLQGSITVFCSRSQWTTPPVCIGIV